MVPALTDTIKELGLVLVADLTASSQPESDKTTATGGTSQRDPPSHRSSLKTTAPTSKSMPAGVNGVLRDTGILRFHDSIDM
jgi:CDK inhibitor PHO81